jgi:hypothetical protein
VFAQSVGEAQFDPAVAAELRDRLVGSRRRLVRAIWDRGVARGELRPDTDPEAAIVQRAPRFAKYGDTTDRQIPVLHLTPTS